MRIQTNTYASISSGSRNYTTNHGLYIGRGCRSLRSRGAGKEYDERSVLLLVLLPLSEATPPEA